MSSIVDQVTALYVCIDDFCRAHPQASQWRRSPYQHPAFTDAEVLTVALLQDCLGMATLKHAYRYAAYNLRTEFPCLPRYAQWLARLHALSAVTGQLVQYFGAGAAGDSAFYLVDSKPLPVCKPIRHGRVRLLREEGAYFGKSSTGWFFGFKVHVLIHEDGAVLAAILTPGNWKDAEVAPALAATHQSGQAGLCLADLAYREQPAWTACVEEGDLYLVTPDAAPPGEAVRTLISSVRERIETVFSQLCNGFVDRVRSRSWEGLWSVVKLRLLYHNLRLAGVLPA